MNRIVNFKEIDDEQIKNFSENDQVRMVEAILFASEKPISINDLKNRLPLTFDIKDILKKLKVLYEHRGVNLYKIGNSFAFRTSMDLKFLFSQEKVEEKKLSKAALETLSIIAYHNSVTRAEIEEIRGVSVSSGTLDILLGLNWIKFGKKRRTPGRPSTFVINQEFLNHFGLEKIEDLPGINELRDMGIQQKEINFEEID